MRLLCLKFAILSLTCLSLTAVHGHGDDEFLYGTFPEGFMWGLATSAYQIEGGWEADGKGPNTWDFWSHQNGGANIDDSKNGDVACDSYNKYLDDVRLLKSMGADFYRFSLSWSRIVPTGRVADGVSLPGIDYYNRLIDALLAEDIVPFITLYHWDTPLGVQNDGGWLNDTIVDHFADYARVTYEAFGDRVKWWLTFNEPHVFCLANWNYGEQDPFEQPPRQQYICAHNVVKSHAKAWRIYDEEYRQTQQGKMGITLNCDWSEPKDRSDPEHLEAMERSVQFRYGWWANPLTRGEYPKVMRDLVDAKSEPGQSRLPTFDPEWTRIINGTLDFLGLNHYSTHYVLPSDGTNRGLDGDANIRTEGDSSWDRNGIGWSVVPSGFRNIITWVSKQYSLPVYITENGYGGSEDEKLDDTGRQNYYRLYINEVLKAIECDGADVRSYTAWSLMDNYEWTMGYTARFGVHYVDFEDANRTRTPKESALQLTKIFAENGFPQPSSAVSGLPNLFILFIGLVPYVLYFFNRPTN
ncbi:myrosinase 1-like [Bradysia coprophila]|uniref:myrosinase 1-like n=1 Tax=Bradysia coprophila TaxID=38358 RepID=UPI00187D9A95|nr:myrosinase 1-like [Bradysia coprophila]